MPETLVVPARRKTPSLSVPIKPPVNLPLAVTVPDTSIKLPPLPASPISPALIVELPPEEQLTSEIET